MNTLCEDELALLKEIARDIRIKTVEMVSQAKSCHIGSALSCADILSVLYFKVLHIEPKDPFWEERDRFIMSKGHACSGVYVTLAHRGFFSEKELKGYIQNGSYFTAHLNSEVKGVELSTGSLGHGLGVGVGMALAAKKNKKAYKIYVLLSDGECDEGSVWEAILSAKQFKLNNLIAIVDYNKIQSFGTVKEVMDLEPFAKKWEAFGWNVQEVNGHDVGQICNAFYEVGKEQEKPSVLIAHTIKGKGISFMENTVECHYLTPTKEQTERAIKELREAK